MGVNLSEIVKGEEIELNFLKNKIIALDAMNAMYQFLSSIRQKDGKPLIDSKGRITSHLSGLFYRSINLLENGIKPVYVFDGKPPKLKQRIIEERKKLREEAEREWLKALEEGDLDKARSYAMRAVKVDSKMIEQAKKLLEYMGIPYVQAPSEGEAQAAYMARKGDVYAAASQDYDSLLFGAPRLIRNLTIVGRRKLPRKNVYVEIKPEIIILENLLKKLKINREQLIDIAILIGTDYNPEGVRGIGIRKALELIRKYKSIEEIVKRNVVRINFPYDEIKELFLNPNVTDDYKISFSGFDKDKIIKLLCEEHDFSLDRVENALKRLEASYPSKKQKSLDLWFK